MKILKSPLRPGLSYPLKSSKLAALIESSHLSIPVTLYLRTETWWTEGVMFRGDFYPPGDYDFFWPGRYETNDVEVFRVTCRSVPSVERQAASEFIETSIFPDLLRWMQAIEALPHNAPRRGERLSVTWDWPRPASAVPQRR